jgi:hypothetical protein
MAEYDSKYTRSVPTHLVEGMVVVPHGHASYFRIFQFGVFGKKSLHPTVASAIADFRLQMPSSVVKASDAAVARNLRWRKKTTN